MRNRKIWKQLVAVALSAVMVIPAPMVSAEEGQMTDGIEEAAYADSEEGAADGFEIDGEGKLINYTGTDTEVVIPDTVKEIGAGAFSDCNNLKSVSIPNSVTGIRSRAFKGCTALEDITIPESVVEIGVNAFFGTKWLENQRQKDLLVVVNNILVDGQKSSGTVTIPETVNSIGAEAFYECSTLENVVIPASVRNIEWAAFYGCSELKSVNIPEEGVIRISDEAFCGCEQLEDMILPKSVTYIGEYAFSNCSRLTELTIPESVASIGGYAFSNCSGLTDLVIPVGVTSIEEGAFSNCSGLTSIKVEKENTVYDSREDCNAIIETESHKLIAACSNTIIPENIVTIGTRAFSGCSGLASVVIPRSVTNIYFGVFADCSNLTSIKVEEGNTVYDSREGCNAIIDTKRNQLIAGCKNTVIPASVAGIRSWAFSNCSGLTSMEIPLGVEEIGESAFRGCNGLTKIEIPVSVTKIGWYAFLDCQNLKSVTIPASVRTIGDISFGYYDYREKDGGGYTCKAIPDFVIYGKNGSVSEWYAKENRFTFSPIVIDGSETDISTAIVTLEKDSYAYDGTAKTPDVTVELDDSILEPDIDYDVAYSNNIEIGTAKVTVTGKGYYTGSVEKTFTISKDGSTSGTNPPDDSVQNGSVQRDISEAAVTLEKNSYMYDGTAKTPSVIVTIDGKTLILNTDYTVVYRNNINPGTAAVIVTGKENYKGTATKHFTIQNASQNNSNDDSQTGSQNLTCAKTLYKKVYGDKPFSLGITLKDSSGTLTCTSSNKKVVTVNNKGKAAIKGTGIASITINVAATGNYKAESVKITVEVSPKKQIVQSLKSTTGRKLKVNWKKDKQATGYQIQYSTDKKFKKGTKTVNIKKNRTISKTISKLKAGKKYYVRVRSYKTAKVNGNAKKLYGAWSGIKRSGSIKK
jgi:hypothetical protein